MSSDTKKLVKELVFGIVLYNIVVFIIAGICFRSAGVFLGLLIGMAGAICMVIHMGYTLEHSIALGEGGGASSYSKRMYFMRFAVALAIFLLVFFTRVVNIFAVIAGAMGLKAAAYLQPLVKRAFIRKEA